MTHFGYPLHQCLFYVRNQKEHTKWWEVKSLWCYKVGKCMDRTLFNQKTMKMIQRKIRQQRILHFCRKYKELALSFFCKLLFHEQKEVALKIWTALLRNQRFLLLASLPFQVYQLLHAPIISYWRHWLHHQLPKLFF